MLKGLAVSAAMAVQDECGGSRSNPVLPAGNGVSLNSGLRVVTGSLIKEHFSCGNDFSPKVRKPYTITKQRERWTEEEHKKFLEALKLYGRAWRRIEEHVGSKTAVQIRSHAQKFFSKVERESSGTTTSPAEPIEIPPPRPKRKPTHPYPRKMVHALNKEASTSEHPRRSLSPNLSISDNENQSPTSVFSVVCSTDSNTPNCSLSPVSCPGGSHSADLTISEINLKHEDNGSLSAAIPINAANDERSPKKLNVFPKEDGLVEEETSIRSLKLFGRTVLITESYGDGNSETAERSTDRNGESTWGHSPQAYAATRPWWALFEGLPFPLGPFPKQETVKVIRDLNEEFQEREIQKEGSSTGSNSGSLNEEESIDRNTNSEILEVKPIERSGSSNYCLKGFVPYKKRAAERENQSTTLTSEEREEKHIRLCL